MAKVVKKTKSAKKDKKSKVEKTKKVVKSKTEKKAKKAPKAEKSSKVKKEKKSEKVSKKDKKEKPAKKEKKSKKGGSPLAKVKYKTSKELQALGLGKVIKGTELMSGIWEYIKNKKNKIETFAKKGERGTNITPDKTMAAIFGNKPLHMTKLASLGGKRDKHLTRVEA